MSLHTNADYLFSTMKALLMQLHVSTQDVQHEQERHEQTYCIPLSKEEAEIIHNELIKPGTNTGNKATKKTQLVLMPSDSHQDQ